MKVSSIVAVELRADNVVIKLKEIKPNSSKLLKSSTPNHQKWHETKQENETEEDLLFYVDNTNLVGAPEEFSKLWNSARHNPK